MHYSQFIAAVRDFALSLGILADFDAPNADVIASFNDGNNLSNYEDLDDLDILRFPFLPYIDANVGCQIYPVVDDLNFKITGAGLGFYFGDEQEILISEKNKLRWNAISTIQDGLGFILRQNGDIEFRHRIFTSNPSSILDGADAELNISWIVQTLEVYETLLDIGISQGIRAEIKRSQLTFDIETQNETDASIELSLSTVFFFLVGNEADSFLKSTLPHQPITIPLELTIIFSALKGFYLKGNSGLEGAVSLNLSISNIFSLHQLFLGVSNVGSDINAFIALNAALNLGPILTEIDGIGLEGSLTFPENNSGNLGPLNVDLGFKPPKGLAIEIEASVVSGGGYLYFDREKAQYSGIIQLEFEGLTLTAIGLLTTRMPDGTSGYSLLIILTVEDFQPIQLGLGFKLTGIGGLFGFNRTVSIDTLRTGLKKPNPRPNPIPQRPPQKRQCDYLHPTHSLSPHLQSIRTRPYRSTRLGQSRNSNRQFRDYHRIPLPRPTGITRANESAFSHAPSSPSQTKLGCTRRNRLQQRRSLPTRNPIQLQILSMGCHRRCRLLLTMEEKTHLYPLHWRLSPCLQNATRNSSP